jgi:outer membrane protein OmpA-like peptidoglycan-associated protein
VRTNIHYGELPWFALLPQFSDSACQCIKPCVLFNIHGGKRIGSGFAIESGGGREDEMKTSLITLLLTTTICFSSGCVATRKFTRNEVKTSADTLNARIDSTNGELKETRDNVDRVNQRVTAVDGRVTTVDGRVTTVDGKVSALDAKTTEAANALKGDVTSLNTKTDRTNGELSNLDEKFQNRNNFKVASEKSIQFKFNSDKLDKSFTADLDEIAAVLIKNPDSLIVLEGHTDATGDTDYNVKLGERRVDAVRRYLAVEKNVPVYKIHMISFGAARPIADNKSKDGREKNRAVNVSVLVPTMQQATANNQ